MQRLLLKAQERELIGKRVKKLRREGIIPGHVYGHTEEAENVAVKLKDFLSAHEQVGETGLIDLRIGEEKIRPVLIREVQYDPVKGGLLNISFYQVNLKERVVVPVPIVLVGEEPEIVHMGEAIVLQNLAEVEVEALPMDLIEKIEVNIEKLRNIGDQVVVSELNYDRDKLSVLAEPDEVVVKVAPAITEEMKQLIEEQEAEIEVAAAEEVAEEGGEAKVDVEEVVGDGESEQAGGGEENDKSENQEKEKDSAG